ncbi:NAD(P)-binding protein [Candidatus Woesearchaeota archaeon]|nr:NAD(P)-binding protein [Candidatus Woesearchaeota archaeon]
MKTIVILGGGFTGLSLANELKDKYKIILIDKNEEVGGMCQSFKWNDIPLDLGPHKIFSIIPGIMDKFREICPDMLEHEKKNSIHLKGKNFDFPLKITQFAFKMNPYHTFRLGIDFLKAQLKNNKEARTYEEYLKQGFGKYGYNLIFRDYAPKLWGEPTDLSEEIARRRIPVPDLKGLLGLSKEAKKKVSAEKFLYPLKGIGEICDNLKNNLKGKVTIITEAKINQIIVNDNQIKKIILKDSVLNPDFVVSTIPLHELIESLNPAKIIINEANRLKYKHLFVSFLLLNKEKAMEDHWRFFPEKDICFNRVAEYKNFNPNVFPSDKTIISAEVTFESEEDLDAVQNRIIHHLKKIGLIKPRELLDYTQKVLKNVYPIYDLTFRHRLKIIYHHLDQINNLITIGRAGCFNYNNMDHCLDMALTAKDFIDSGKNKKEWVEIRKRFDEYKIID